LVRDKRRLEACPLNDAATALSAQINQPLVPAPRDGGSWGRIITKVSGWSAAEPMVVKSVAADVIISGAAITCDMSVHLLANP
jgi:hypothetical protein